MIQFKRIPINNRSRGLRSSVFGVGVNDADYLTKINIEGETLRCPFYIVWHSMLRRCYSNLLISNRPTYVDCKTTSEWLYFSNFKDWMVGQDWKGKHLDKDLIKPHNKLYSPETCVFVSSEINNLILDSKKIRGEYPQGVVWHKRNKKFTTSIKHNGKKVHLGSFVNVDEASNSYIIAKCEHILNYITAQSDEKVIQGLHNHIKLLREGLK